MKNTYALGGRIEGSMVGGQMIQYQFVGLFYMVGFKLNHIQEIVSY